MDTVLLYKGPQFFNELSNENYLNVHSFLDILKLPQSDSRLPLWRQAYLSGELKCMDTKPASNLSRTGRLLGIYMREDTFEKGIAACGMEFHAAFYANSDPLGVPECSTGIPEP